MGFEISKYDPAFISRTHPMREKKGDQNHKILCKSTWWRYVQIHVGGEADFKNEAVKR